MIKGIIKIAEMASDIIMSFYRGDKFDISLKKDKLPVAEAGCSLVSYPDTENLVYNKFKIANPFFVASRNGLSWQ